MLAVEDNSNSLRVKREATIDDVYRLQTVPRTLNQITQVVQDLMESAVCVIWKTSRTISLPLEEHPIGRLYPYSSTFATKTNVQHAGLPMDLIHDTTGRFYTTKELFAFENDFPAKDAGSPSQKFMQGANLKRVCMARFSMAEPGSDPNEFVVSVYRRHDQDDYTHSDAERLRVLASFFPVVYGRMNDLQLKEAVIKVNNLLRSKCISIEQARKHLDKLCPELAQIFHCHEISIYLREPHSASDDYTLISTTLDCGRMIQTYNSDRTRGLTNYVISTGESIWFNDLYNIRDKERSVYIRKRYRDIAWSDGAQLGIEAKNIFCLTDDDPRPPLSFLAVPIFGENDESGKAQEVIGVIRACLGKNPFYFIKSEVDSFEIIAKEISRWWDSLGHALEQAKRADVWEALKSTLSVQHDLLRDITSDFDSSSKLAIATVDSLIKQPSFEMAFFRRGNAADRLIQVTGAAKGTGTIDTDSNTIVPFNERLIGKFEAGLHIQVIERSPNKSEDFASEERKLFLKAAKVLTFVIAIDQKLFGVLDVGFLNAGDLQIGEQRILDFLELTARQLALFERVRASIETAQQARSNELKTYAAITHQLRSPLLTATKRLRALLDQVGQIATPEVEALQTINGMVRKAYSVTATIEMVGKIVRNEPIEVVNAFEKVDALRKLVLEICFNHRLLSPIQMKLSFAVEPTATWGETSILWNKNCAENSLDAVISNAFKYSKPGQVIQIVGRQEEELFTVQIISRGLVLLADDVSKCIQYEWRGEEAKKLEGGGIGLWVTNHYMNLQQGKLQVHPTNKNGETVIELAFKTKQASSQ